MTIIIPESEPVAPVVVVEEIAETPCDEHCNDHTGRIAALEAELEHIKADAAEAQETAESAESTAEVAIDIALSEPVAVEEPVQEIPVVEPQPEPEPEPIQPKRTILQKLIFGA
jgi:hypothetical protein